MRCFITTSSWLSKTKRHKENYLECKSGIGTSRRNDWAVFTEKNFSDNTSAWQIDAVSKYAIKLKEEEIEHSLITPKEKENKKRLRKGWIEVMTRGVKVVFWREGRMS